MVSSPPTVANPAGPPAIHFRRPREGAFTRADKDRVTLLYTGLTPRHEYLFRCAFEGAGYLAEPLAIPTKKDFQTGREYGNNGQCNPTYFTVGALVNHLKSLRDQGGLSAEEIVDRFACFSAGSCGPCRFGMYEAEFRLALRNAGFDGFRVLLFEQNRGFSQHDDDVGLDWTAGLILSLVNALLVGDVLNAVGYHIRPYELKPGQTDRVLADCLSLCGECLRRGPSPRNRPRAAARLLSRLAGLGDPGDAQLLLDALRSDYLTSALAECAQRINDEIEVDYTRVRPIVEITGEFWAQTTEGDGNFNMFRFLERESAEVMVEPIAGWIAYVAHHALSSRVDRRGLDEVGGPPRRWEVGRRLGLQVRDRRRELMFALGSWILSREYTRLRVALGGTIRALPSQRLLQRLAHPYYNSRSAGGEGHVEVAKSIYCSSRKKAHMVLSLKPFGCMPSTQSDGVHAAVRARHPNLNFLPIETSGEGDINAHSRVQMALSEARESCKEEVQAAIEQTGHSLEEIRAYVAGHRELRRPLQHVPETPDSPSQAARFILGVGERMRAA